MRKDHNLSNRNSEPEHAEMTCSVMVHFDPYQGAFPKKKMIQWLQSLPDEAKVKFVGVASGKPHFEATWTEQR